MGSLTIMTPLWNITNPVDSNDLALRMDLEMAWMTLEMVTTTSMMMMTSSSTPWTS